MDTTKTLEQLKQRFLEQYGSYEFVGILDNAGYPRSETMQRIETLVERVFLATLDAVEEAMPKEDNLPARTDYDLGRSHGWNYCITEALAAITDLRENL